MIEARMAQVPALVAQMRRDDREFITAETVSMFSECSRPEAAIALTRLGFTPRQIGTLQALPDGRSDPDGPLPVVIGDRVFTVIRGGKRWTKVPEYMSNGQLTARWFVDEATGEVRSARSWKSPQNYAERGAAVRFALDIVARAKEAVA